jgi:hypothetical protein
MECNSASGALFSAKTTSDALFGNAVRDMTQETAFDQR